MTSGSVSNYMGVKKAGGLCGTDRAGGTEGHGAERGCTLRPR